MKHKNFFNIALLGAPGCGKGTQADLIKRRYNLYHVSTGDLYRKEIAAGTELGLMAKELIDRGELCPDELTLNMLFEYLSHHSRTKGFILDGVPRTLEQAHMMEGIGFDHVININMAIYIKVEKEIVAERLYKRAQLIGRTDDSPEIIKQRIINYENLTYPVAKYFRQKGLLYKIDGMRSVEEVFGDICKVIDENLNNDKV